MKYKIKTLSAIVILSLSTWHITASADAIADKLAFSKSDALISDKVFYQIGGGAGYMAPPTRGTTNAYEFGLGWKANLMCGNFDVKTTVKNQLNGLTEGFKDLMGNVIESAKGAVASMPAMILQRANPQLYDLITNGVYQGKIDFNRLKTSCESMANTLADATMGGKWSSLSDLESFRNITATEPDANKAQKQLDQNKGKKGIDWVGGHKAGGEGQQPIKLIEDVTKAGYNLLNKRNALDTGAITGSNCNGALCQTWSSPQDTADWLTKVIGEQSLSTCKEDCGTPVSAKAGVGLSPLIEQEIIETVTKLQTILNVDSPTPAMLAELGSQTVPITRGLIETLRDDPDVDLLANRLASEIALSKTMEKMLLARRTVLAGMREPYVSMNADAQTELEKVLTKIDREISQVKLELDLQKSLTSNTANVIFENRATREANTGAYGTPEDNTDKRIYDLENAPGKNDNELAPSNDISIPRNNIQLTIPSASNLTPYVPSFGAGGRGPSSGSYTPISAISGSAMEQATGLLRHFEGFSSKAYWDVNAYRTGYGSDTITKADGTIVKVTKDTVITRADAERDLARRAQLSANRAKGQVSSSTWNSLPSNVQAALTSYAYNYGSLTKDVVEATHKAVQSNNMKILADAVRKRQTNNNGVNAKRRNQEADYITNGSKQG